MSRQGMFERLNPGSSEFLVRVMNELLCKEPASSSDSLFQRILIEDSTIISMAESNAHHFPDDGNGKVETAGCKINLVTDWITGRPVDAGLRDARDPDQTIGFDLTSECRAGDLIVRDRGYFSLDALEEIERHDAFWISRLPASLTCFDGEGVYLDEILNYYRHYPTSALIESINGRLQLARRKARGYRNFANFRAIAYWIAGDLEPLPATHTI